MHARAQKMILIVIDARSVRVFFISLCSIECFLFFPKTKFNSNILKEIRNQNWLNDLYQQDRQQSQWLANNNKDEQ
jgi:hypothetical protein